MTYSNDRSSADWVKKSELFDSLGTAVQDAQSQQTIGKGVLKRIDNAWKIVAEGNGPSFLSLKQGDYLEDISQSERFFRLQKAREKLDEGIDYDAIRKGLRPMNTDEQIL